MATTRGLQLAILSGVCLGLLAATDLIRAEEDKPSANQPADSKSAPKSPEQVFADLDKNSDGKLTAAEIPQDQQRMYERVLRVAGKEKGSEITKAEFLAALKPDDLRVAPPQNLGGGGGRGNFDPGQLFQRLDRNKDGKLTLDEVPEQNPGLRQMFTRLNKTELTREEFAQAAGRGAFGGRGPMGDPEAFFKRLDADQDGKLTLSEVPEQFRPQLERMLTALGKGKEDGVTGDEFKKLAAENQARDGGRPGNGPPGMQRPGDGRGGFGALWLRKLDTNGDGKLSKEELSKAADLFDELDVNKDGVLEPSELFGPPPEGGRPAGPGGRPGAAGRPRGRPQPEAQPGSSNDSKESKP